MSKSSIYNVTNSLVIDLADISYITALNAYGNWTIGLKNNSEIKVEIASVEDSGCERTFLVSAWKAFKDDSQGL